MKKIMIERQDVKMEKKIIEMLEEVMEVDEGVLTMETELDNIEEWDSISKLALMAEVKRNWNKKLTVESLKSFKVVKDIYDFLVC